jgi:hypothetical protein
MRKEPGAQHPCILNSSLEDSRNRHRVVAAGGWAGSAPAQDVVDVVVADVVPDVDVVVVVGVVTTVAFPSAVVAALEIRKPSPLATVHFTPAVDDEQVNGPSVIDWP